MRALLVEDDLNQAKAIELMLKSAGMVVDVANYGEDGIEIGKLYDYDIIILDLMLPDIDGFEVLRALRGAKIETPILILSGLDQPLEKVKGFEIGADDYLTKPYNKEELIARINAIVRRSKGHAQSVIHTGKLSVNLDNQTVECDGKPVHLTSKEYGILELLSLRKGSTLTKEMFLNHLYGGMDEPELKIIDVFVCKLRKKLTKATKDNYIHTVWGRGYVLRDPDEEAPAKIRLTLFCVIDKKKGLPDQRKALSLWFLETGSWWRWWRGARCPGRTCRPTGCPKGRTPFLHMFGFSKSHR